MCDISVTQCVVSVSLNVWHQCHSMCDFCTSIHIYPPPPPPRVVSPDKTYTLQAEDELDKQEWIEALQVWVHLQVQLCMFVYTCGCICIVSFRVAFLHATMRSVDRT